MQLRLGGVAGGLLGALTNAGISEEDAQVFVEGVRRGGSLVAARVPQTESPRVEAIMNQSAVPAGTLRPLPQVGLAVVRSERGALHRRSGSLRARPACPLAAWPEFDVRQGRGGPVASFSVDREFSYGRELAGLAPEPCRGRRLQ
ncbi:MAG: hypothetical protein JWP51_1018 [Bradyrhizobium sp.]|nr:hypothetical protein [Bradyrhizobium sp.]